MYARKKFDEREVEYSILLRRKLEEAESMLLKLNQCIADGNTAR